MNSARHRDAFFMPASRKFNAHRSSTLQYPRRPGSRAVDSTHPMNRRDLLKVTGASGFLSLSTGLAMAQESGASTAVRNGTSPLSRMTWLNAPPAANVERGTLRVRSKPKADFYRLPGWSVDDGNFFYLAASGEFTFQARVDGQFAARYDQAGLMVRLNAENWVKCGTELNNGQRYASVVFTRTFSDWSSMRYLSQNAPVWWRVVRKKEALEALFSLDGKSFTSLREGYFPASGPLQVGIYCASPEGEGVSATFDSLILTQA
jgi:regulation of enolase protein 1 (concanavalin A-like superfamily)